MLGRRVAALLLLVWLAAACSPDGGAGEQGGRSADIEQSQRPPPASPTAEVVDQVLPSVVHIRTTALRPDFFGQPTESRAEGSGIVIDRNGTIVTNNHVVQGALRVQVIFTEDRARMEGEVIGTSSEHDLAVVRVDADDLDPVEIGRSSQLQLGDDAIAIGFPLGLGGPTVTRGIISGLDRTVQAQNQCGVERLEGVLQTDAAINPGNSGGPLVDSAGQLVGINTAGASPAAAENLGFAIAIDSALPVIREIVSQPEGERAWLGVQVQSIDSAAAAALAGLDPAVRGAVVVAVVPDSPAAAAGIEPGEVIVRLADRDIRSAADLTSALTAFDPGEDVEVRLAAPGGSRNVQVELRGRPPTLEC